VQGEDTWSGSLEEAERVHAPKDSGAPGGDMDAEEEAAEADTVRDELESLRTQVDELSQRLLRAQADFDNFRKRTRQEKEELTQYANAKLIADLLPVMDNFLLAIQAASGQGEAEVLMKGVDMVFRQLAGVLEKAGVRTMEPVGEPFDPNRHEAVLSEAAEGIQPGVVLEVLRTGYLLQDRVLRPAMVKVSQ
jgi:molecular chaperone GrpE